MTGCGWALSCPLPAVGAAVSEGHPTVPVCVAHASSAGNAGWICRRLRGGKTLGHHRHLEPADLVCTCVEPRVADDGCAECQRPMIDPDWVDIVEFRLPETRAVLLLRRIVRLQAPALARRPWHRMAS